MTIIALPINASSGSPAYNARQTRQAFAALMMPGSGPLRTRSGWRPGGQPTVSVTSTTWTAGAFSAVIDAGVSSIQGPYLVASDANSTGATTAADATFGRVDLLYVQVSDTDEDGSGARQADVLYLAGTPAASPSAPATPARSLVIGTISVPRSGAGSPAFTPNNHYATAAGGVVPVGSKAERDALSAYAGMTCARTDLTPVQLQTHDGTAWPDLPQVGAVIARALRTTNAGPASATAVGILRLDGVPVVAGQAYEISLSPVSFISTVAAGTRIEADIRVSTSGTATTSTPVYTSLIDQALTVSGDQPHKGLSVLYPASTTGTISILLTVVRLSGSGNVFLGASATLPMHLWVTYAGVDPGDSGVVL